MLSSRYWTTNGNIKNPWLQSRICIFNQRRHTGSNNLPPNEYVFFFFFFFLFSFFSFLFSFLCVLVCKEDDWLPAEQKTKTSNHQPQQSPNYYLGYPCQFMKTSTRFLTSWLSRVFLPRLPLDISWFITTIRKHCVSLPLQASRTWLTGISLGDTTYRP